MSEAAVLTSVARIRSMVTAIPDPELPVVSIGDLGMIEDVRADDGSIVVTVLPTFIGCPALDVIVASITDRLAGEDRPVVVDVSFAVPWTTERVTPAGRAALQAAGIAPPAEPEDMRCPHCGSGQVVIDSAFGPTQCRSLFYCRGCRQPFEAMKPV